jgi:hypothetical protein
MILAVVLDMPLEHASNNRGWKNVPDLRHFPQNVFTSARWHSPPATRTYRSFANTMDARRAER